MDGSERSEQATAPSAEPPSGTPPSPDGRAPVRRSALTARPPVFRGQPYSAIGAFLAAMSLYWLWRVSGNGLAGENLMSTWVFYAIIVVGFYLVFGISGQFAFSQAAFAGLGGYTSNWAAKNHSFWLGFLCAMAVTAVVSAIFALLVRRATHFYFAIATLGISTIALLVIRNWDDLNGGLGGEVTNIRKISIFGNELDTAGNNFAFLLAVLGLVMVLTAWLQRSPYVRESIANRDKDVVSGTLGVPTLRLRVSAFVLASVAAGMAGSIYAHWKGILGPEQWSIDLGLGIFLMLILGGISSMWGAILGAWFYTYVIGWLDFADKYRQMIYGSLLIVVMIALPDGLVGAAHRIRSFRNRTPGQATAPNWLAALLGLRRTPADETPQGEQPVVDEQALTAAAEAAASRDRTTARQIGAPIIEARDISVSFGGVRAVDDVSLTVHENEILGLIGPNGSGKSTFVNALTGVVSANGNLSIDGERTGLGRPRTIRRAGILRTYQTPQTYLALSCIENVLLSTSDRQFTGILSAWFLRPLMLRRERRRWDRASAALAEVGLLDRAEQTAAALSYGQQRLLELTRVIAADPRVILLDEPSAGLNAAETQNLSRHLARLRDRGIALLVIDHKIDFISQLCDRVAVLELGHMVAEGDPVTVWEDERVISAYLGVDDSDEDWDITARPAPPDAASTAPAGAPARDH
jgi:branched-chain amino acid transport system permease protein